MDFQDRLGDYIESLNLGIPFYNDINGDKTSLALYTLPGSRIVETFMDESVEKMFNLEIQGKAQLNERTLVYNTLNSLSEALQELEELTSKDKSFEFNRMTVSSEPYFNDAETDGFLFFRLTFEAYLTIN